MSTDQEQVNSWPWCLASKDTQDKIKNAKLLMVGAGGIGCELLKTLVLTGFKNIDVIDLDTIETSNLNRQFLFRKRHVGHSKAEVAARAVSKLRNDLNITAYQANIKESRFDVNFFRQFDMVLNGLDNLDARRHVNRLCLAANVPLVESGTAGYLGQVSVHIGGKIECFECQPKPTPKSFPICTIRNTPEKPVHCVVWAKELLFPRLFGAPEAATDLDAGGENNNHEANGDANEPPPDDISFYARKEGESATEYARRIFKRVFADDMDTLRSVEDLWKLRRPPSSLDVDRLSIEKTVSETQASAPGTACQALGLKNSHSVWSTEENAAVFLEAVRRFLEHRPDEVGAAQFDKDDDLAVEVVAAAANLRSICFGIAPQSLFDVKGMAGNIIHAIATTNAIISGLITTEALKLLAGCHTACKTTFLRQDLSGRKLLVPANSEPPNKSCMVCGKARAYLTIDTASTTLKEFLDKVARRRLSLVEPTVTCDALYYEEGEGLEEDEVATNAKLLPMKLADLPGTGIRDGAIIEVSDQSQAFNVQIVVTHRDKWDEEEFPEKFELAGTVPVAQADQEAANGTDGEKQTMPNGTEKENKSLKNQEPVVRELSDGVFELIDDDDEQPAAGTKRKQGGDDVAVVTKRAKKDAVAVVGDDEDDVVDLLDDE